MNYYLVTTGFYFNPGQFLKLVSSVVHSGGFGWKASEAAPYPKF